LVDEAASLARLNHTVNGPDRRFGQHNVDAFAHGMKVNAYVDIIYTKGVYVKCLQ
jgi:hypothetical protein